MHTDLALQCGRRTYVVQNITFVLFCKMYEEPFSLHNNHVQKHLKKSFAK